MKKEKCLSAAVFGMKLPEDEQSTKNKVKTLPPLREEDTQRLLHELEAHRNKLEMQNTELLKTREKLQTSLASYADLYDFSPVAYFTLASNGAILGVNLTGASLLGTGRSRLIGRYFQLFVPVKERPAFIAFLDRVLSSKARESYETTLKKEETPANYVRIEAVAGQFSRNCRLAVIDITERKLAEEALLDSEARYRRLFETETDAILLIDLETHSFLDVNPAALEMYGYSLEEFLRLTTDDISAEPEKTRQAIATGQIRVSYRLHRKKGGALFPVEIAASHYAYHGREVHVAAMRDITERVRTERILQARLRLLQFANSHSLEELLQATLEELEILTGSTISFYHFVETDHKTLSLQAWSTGTLSEFCKTVGKGRHYDISEAGVWVDAVHEQRPVIHNDYSALPHRKGLPRGHAEVAREMVVPIFRGEKIVAILGVGNKPNDYNDQDMETVTLLTDMVWDIVEQKRAGADTARAKENCELFFNLIPELACIASTDGFFKKLNPAWETALGYNCSELQDSSFLDFIHPEDIDTTVNAIERLINGCSSFNIKNRYRHKDGTFRWLEWVALPVRDTGLIYAAARDITDMIRLEEEAKLNQAKLIQANKMSSLGLIASGIAHEINNPNNYILSNATLLAEAWRSAMPILEEYYRENGDFNLGDVQYSTVRDNAPRFFSGLVEGAKRIREIVERIKDFARQDTGITEEAFDVGKMILDATAILDHEIKRCCENFRIEAASALPQARGNVQQIGQVMINLLVNALQALPDRKCAIRIETGKAEDGEQIFIKVEDDGVGIPAEALEHICDPFFTTKRTTGGTGLGLSISASILKENQGTLSFSSEPGRGTTATVLLRRLK